MRLTTIGAIIASLLLTASSLACPADITESGTVDVHDLLKVIEQWGDCPQQDTCPADISGPFGEPDGTVDVHDLLAVLAAWGDVCHLIAPTSTIIFDRAGTFDFVVPEGVTTISGLAIGTGAFNGSLTTGRHAGSGAGALSYTEAIPVTPGETLQVRVAQPQSNSTEAAHDAMAAWISRGATMLLYAEGGRTGVTSTVNGGSAENGFGDIRRSGGAGGDRGTTAGGGGGGAPTLESDGQDGGDGSGTTPGTGGDEGGGDGGAPEEVGNAGTEHGAGSGGKGSTSEEQATPASLPGLVTIEMELPTVVTSEDHPQAVVDALNGERVAYAMIGDSNVLHGGNTGHYQGMEKAQYDTFGIHGFGLRPAGTSVGGMGAWFNGVRARHLEGDDVLEGDDESLPQDFRDYLAISAPSRFAGLLDGDTVSVTSPRQLQINPDDHATNPSLFGVDEAMRFHMQLGVWNNEDATGDNPKVRLNVGAETTTIAETVLDPGDTLDDDYGVTEVSVDIPAKDRGSDRLEVRYWEHNNAASQLTGPFYAMYLWGELLDVHSGPISHILRYDGGHGIREAMQRLEDVTDLAIENKLEIMKSTLPADDPKIVFHISHGGNDRSDDEPSWGGSDWDSPYPGNSAVGFHNNLKHMMDYFTERAEAVGFESDDIHFVLTYHPQPGHVETLANFEGGAAMLTPDYNLVIVRGTAITTPQEMTCKGWYNSWNGSFGDNAHLSKTGYEQFNARVLDALTDLSRE